MTAAPEYLGKVSVCGLRRKDRAQRAIRDLHHHGLVAFWSAKDRSVNMFVTTDGAETCERWLREALRKAGEPVAL